MITASLVAELREMTGAGIMDAKRALEETQGDLALAADVLRKKGIAKAANKASRETHEGLVHAYLHSTGKLGAMVEVLCETDFVARTEGFQNLCHDLALHIAAMNPLWVCREDVPAETIEHEKSIYREEPAMAGKPADVVEKILEGKLNKFFTERCLLEQPFVKDDTKTVDEVVKEVITALGENIQVRRFSRLQIG